MAQALELDRQKILSQVERLVEHAKENSWEYDYDEMLDQLVYGKGFMPRDSFLFNVNDEINIFITPDSSVHGIFIEYFKSNFLNHNTEFRPVLEIIETGREDQKAEECETAFELELAADAFKSLSAKEKLVTAI